MKLVGLFLIALFLFAFSVVEGQRGQANPDNKSIKKCPGASKMPKSMDVNCTATPCQVKVDQTISINVTFDTGACTSISCRPSYTNALLNNNWMPVPCVDLCQIGCKCPTLQGHTCNLLKSGKIPPLVLIKMAMSLKIVICCHSNTVYGCLIPGNGCPAGSVEIACVTTDAIVNPADLPKSPAHVAGFQPFQPLPPAPPLSGFPGFQPLPPAKPAPPLSGFPGFAPLPPAKPAPPLPGFPGFAPFPPAKPAPPPQPFPGFQPLSFPGFPPN